MTRTVASRQKRNANSTESEDERVPLAEEREIDQCDSAGANGESPRKQGRRSLS